MKELLSLLIIPASLVLFLFAGLSPSRPATLLGAGIGLALTAVMARRGAIVVVLIVMLLALTACGSDPLGIVARQEVRSAAQVQTAQIQADAATNQARISASTARVRVGGWMVGAMIAAIAFVAVAAIAGMTHLQAQRDRLSVDQWRNQLPVMPTATALPRARPAGHWLALSRTAQRQPERPTLALPARSESAHDVIVVSER